MNSTQRKKEFIQVKRKEEDTMYRGKLSLNHSSPRKKLYAMVISQGSFLRRHTEQEILKVLQQHIVSLFFISFIYLHAIFGDYIAFRRKDLKWCISS